MKKTLILSIILLVFLTQCSATAQKRSFGEVLDDNVISVKLRTKYLKDDFVPAKKIKIHVWKGEVVLKGSVEKQAQINKAIEIAEKQEGVTQVRSYLRLKPVTTKEKKSIYWPFAKQETKQAKKTDHTAVIEEDLKTEDYEDVAY